MFKILTILSWLSVIIYSDDLLGKFEQHDYNIKFTWAELVNINKSFYKYYKLAVFKYNRTIAAANVTFEFKKQFDNRKSTVIVQGYKFLSNEYRTFPLRFQISYCNALERNTAGSADVIQSCGNVTLCELNKDVIYHACNIFPDASRFPPLIPNGQYKIEMSIINEKSILMVANGYGEVSRTIKHWES